MIKKIFSTLIFSITMKASSICHDGIWINNIDINKLLITIDGNEPMWNASITNGSVFSFNFLEKLEKKVSLFFSEKSNIIFFETKDKSIFGKIVLIDKCTKNEGRNYYTEVVINNRLHVSEFTYINYSISKIRINNKLFKSLYSFCKATGIKESEIRKLNPWINKDAMNILADAEIIVPIVEKGRR